MQAEIDAIIEKIDNRKEKLSNRKLLEICKNVNFLKNGRNPHFCHEIAETALNFIVKTKYVKELFNTESPSNAYKQILEPLQNRLPTQTWRSIEQNKWQQFSTPPSIAYLLAFLLNLKPNEQILEPSAGTGSLAIWASGFGLKTYTNEIDARRRELLEFLDFKPTSFNAEFINDFLPGEIEPDCILMNPPFSSNGGRTANNSSKFGFRHVSSALERLKDGGKFGIILGNSAGLDTRTGKQFWEKLLDRISIKAIIKIAGREYSKNGTSVDVNLIIGTKYKTKQKNGCKRSNNAITSISVKSVEEAFALTQELNLRLD